MKNKIKFSFGSLGNWLKEAPWFLGSHVFLVILICVLAEIILGGFLIYNYVFLSERKDVKIAEDSLKFQDETYQAVLSQWQTRDEEFKKSPQENYKSPF